MAGNSQRRGATTKGKGKTAGSGGRIRRSLEGRGPTPKAEERTYHKAYKAKQAAQRRGAAQPKKPARSAVGADWVVGRNPVFEALTAGLPVKQAYVAELPSARLVVIEHSRHATPMDQPDRFNAVLDDFLAQVEQPQPQHDNKDPQPC